MSPIEQRGACLECSEWRARKRSSILRTRERVRQPYPTQASRRRRKRWLLVFLLSSVYPGFSGFGWCHREDIVGHGRASVLDDRRILVANDHESCGRDDLTIGSALNGHCQLEANGPLLSRRNPVSCKAGTRSRARSQSNRRGPRQPSAGCLEHKSRGRGIFRSEHGDACLGRTAGRGISA